MDQIMQRLTSTLALRPRFDRCRLAALYLTLWLSLITLAGCEKKPDNEGAQVKAVPVKLKKIEATNVSSFITLVGAMDSRSSVDLFPRVDGYISKINVDPGMIVSPGQVLFQIDSSKQQAAVAAKRSSVELARADYAKEVGKLGSLQAEIDARQSMVDFNNLEYQRYYWLEKRGVVAAAVVDQQDRDLRVAKSRVASLKAEIAAQKDVIERARQRISEAQAELKAEEAELSYHIVRAPFAGLMGNVPVKLGDYVNSQTALSKVSKTRPLEVNVEVPEEQAKLIRVGTTMEILDNDGTTYGDIPVSYVAPTVNLQNQSVLIKGNFPNLNDELRPDQSVQVKLILKSAPAVTVPTEAISFVAGKAFIFVAEKGPDGREIARQRPVEITSIQNNAATIQSGLKSGENLIVSGIQLLSEGSPIEATGEM